MAELDPKIAALLESLRNSVKEQGNQASILSRNF